LSDGVDENGFFSNGISVHSNEALKSGVNSTDSTYTAVDKIEREKSRVLAEHLKNYGPASTSTGSQNPSGFRLFFLGLVPLAIISYVGWHAFVYGLEKIVPVGTDFNGAGKDVLWWKIGLLLSLIVIFGFILWLKSIKLIKKML